MTRVSGDVVAVIGAGGKTSLIVGLGYELAESGWRVLATATFPFAAHQLELMPGALPIGAGPDAISDALTEYKFVFLYHSIQRLKEAQKEWQEALALEPENKSIQMYLSMYDYEPQSKVV